MVVDGGRKDLKEERVEETVQVFFVSRLFFGRQNLLFQSRIFHLFNGLTGEAT